MAKGLKNHTGTVDNEEVIYCVRCGQPEHEEREHLDCANCGHSKEHIPCEACESCGETEEVKRSVTVPPQGYAPLRLAGSWHKVGNAMCCSVRCALAESGYTEEHGEYHAALDAVTPTEILTPEQVAAMPSPLAGVDSVIVEGKLQDVPEFDPTKIAENGGNG